MPFPLAIAGREVASPAALAALVRDDAREPTLVPGQRPAAWVMEAVADGALERELAIGLAAALLQHEDPVTIAEGARLAAALGERALGRLLLYAVDGHDVGLLLAADPADPLTSVEETLLRAAGEVMPVAESGTRAELLTRLRNAGLPDVELHVLCEAGSPDEVRRWLPAVLAEEVGEAGEQALRERLAAGDPVSDAIREVLEILRPELLG